MDDPRFQHVASDPRFKTIPKRSRKVTIDPRFQSMFSGKQFKIKYNVDKRGRRVKESSGENLRKYYQLEEDGREVGGGKKKEKSGASVEQDSDSSAESALSDSESRDSSEEEEGEEEEEEGSDLSSSEDDASLCDLYLPGSGGEGQMVGEGEGWREEDSVPLSEDTSRRLALCNMDWDRMGAEDVFVLFNSFKPAGASVLSVTVYPSDFGLERMAREELEGPVGVGGMAGMSVDEEGEEGGEYSEEKLRQYQLSRFKYYYAIVECDGVRTAEHLYQQCNGLEYEHSGGQLDLRFVPDDMSFEDRQPKSVASEESIKPGFVPSDFVSSALQQSKVKLKWDETDPHRLHITQRKFTKDDLQSMNFSAYLASSSESEGEGPEKEVGEEEEEEEEKAVRALRYKELLGVGASDAGEAGSEGEVMEITWEPGLVETAEKLVKKKKKGKEKATPWEQYLQRKKEKRSEMKRKRRKEDSLPDEGEASQDAGFDDPFFHHSVTAATASATKKKGKKKEVLGDTEKQERDELELLVMSEGEGQGEGQQQQQHFSLDKILRSEREPGGRGRKRGKKERDVVSEDTFKVDVADPRFEALYESHLYAPDPSAPQYRATKGMSDLMTEKQRRGRKRAAGGVASHEGGGGTATEGSAAKRSGAAGEEGREGRARKKWKQDPATGQPLSHKESLDVLVASVKSKTKERHRKLKT